MTLESNSVNQTPVEVDNSDMEEEEKVEQPKGRKKTSPVWIDVDELKLKKGEKPIDKKAKVKKLMAGTELTKQERESKLVDEFNRFTSEKRHTIQSYYMRFAKLMNDIDIIGLNMTKLQTVQGRQTQSCAGNIGKGKATGTMGVVKTVGDYNANPPKVIRSYKCRSKGNYAKQCTAKKRVNDLEWFKEKMLLSHKQKAGIELDDEQQYFMDVFDSDCDDAQTASAIFMARLSPVGSVNGDDVGPSNDTNIISEVPNYDNSHDNDMFHPFV
ncbi:hypothetical protein Tco_1272499 [Tanacetum coccineum]